MGNLAILTLLDLDFSVFPFSWAKSELALAINVFHPLNIQLAVPNYDILYENVNINKCKACRVNIYSIRNYLQPIKKTFAATKFSWCYIYYTIPLNVNVILQTF